MRNYIYIILSNSTPYNSTTPGSYMDMLQIVSANPGKLYGVARMGDDQYLYTDAPITNPFDLNQKLITGAIISKPIVTEPVGTGSGTIPIVPGIPESALDNLTQITAITSALVFPCYILPKFSSLAFTTEGEFVQYGMS
jgi:hypothetical protein